MDLPWERTGWQLLRCTKRPRSKGSTCACSICGAAMCGKVRLCAVVRDIEAACLLVDRSPECGLLCRKPGSGALPNLR